jgi:hypothetical protein
MDIASVAPVIVLLILLGIAFGLFLGERPTLKRYNELRNDTLELAASPGGSLDPSKLNHDEQVRYNLYENIGDMSYGSYDAGLWFVGIACMFLFLILIGLGGQETITGDTLRVILLGMVGFGGGYLIGAFWGQYANIETDANKDLYKTMIAFLVVFVGLFAGAVYGARNLGKGKFIGVTSLAAAFLGVAFILGAFARKHVQGEAGKKFFDGNWIATGVLTGVFVLGIVLLGLVGKEFGPPSRKWQSSGTRSSSGSRAWPYEQVSYQPYSTIHTTYVPSRSTDRPPIESILSRRPSL